MRNWSIEIESDGRKVPVVVSPRGKQGRFYLKIKQLDAGKSIDVLWVRAIVNYEGKLVLDVMDPDHSYPELYSRITIP